MDRRFFDNIMLWLMLIAIASICILFFYVGVTGMASATRTYDSWAEQAYAVAGYLMYLLIPLMLLSLALDNIIISRVLEWTTAILMIAVVADIAILIVMYLVAYWL